MPRHRHDSQGGACPAYPCAAMSEPKTYDVRTHGCQMNVHDSERLAGLLETAGYVDLASVPAAQRPDVADVVVFNTHNIGSLPALLDRARHNKRAEVEILESLETFPSTLPTRRDSAFAGWVSISVG